MIIFELIFVMRFDMLKLICYLDDIKVFIESPNAVYMILVVSLI